MAIRVSPTEPFPTHDISLTDGITTVGLHLCNGQGVRDHRAIRQASTPRTSLQIQQGDLDYSGFNLPYTPQTQKDWSGGRGQADFKRDSTRYYDSEGLNTVFGPIILGPNAWNTTQYTTSQGGTYASVPPASVIMGDPPNAVSYLAGSWTAGAPLVITSITLMLQIVGPMGGDFTLQIYDGANPFGQGSPLFTSERLHFGELPNPTEVTFPVNFTFTNAHKYWIGYVYSPYGNSFARFGLNNTPGYAAEEIKYFYGMNDVIGSYASGETLWFRTDNRVQARVHFFDYKGVKYAVQTNDDGSAPKIFQNGYRGLATSNAGALTTTKTNLDLTGITANAMQGNVIKIISGTGATERVSWRTILSNTNLATANTITVSQAWNITQDATTEFVILGMSRWVEITGHGLTGPITDVCVVGDVVYFCQGETINIKRGSIQAGAWVWADDGTNKATFMELIPKTDGSALLWLANATACTIYTAPTVAWGANLVLTQQNSAKPVGNPAYKITNLIGYDTPRICYVLKEDSFGSMSEPTGTTSSIYGEIPNSELTSVAGEYNGRAACVFGVYLFFTILDGFERYYNQRLDDIGPNRDEGLPVGRRGPISAVCPYPGGIYAAVDAGVAGQSSILFWSSATSGWHEMYRAPYGQRISDLSVQVIPGLQYQLIWFNIENNLYWLPAAINPLKVPGFPFNLGGDLISSWYKTTLGQIKKFWRDLQIFAEQINNSTGVITVSYQVDDTGVWIPLPNVFANSAGNGAVGNANPKVLLSNNLDVVGERIRFKVHLGATQSGATPRIIAWTLDAVTRVPPSKTWGITFQADDMNIQEGEADAEPLDMAGLLAVLERWSDSESTPAPITMRSIVPTHDNKRVFIDAPNVSLRELAQWEEDRTVKAIGNLALYEA